MTEKEMEESKFFEGDGILVTNARFIVSEKTYALSAINSIRVAREDEAQGRELYKFGVFGLLLWALIEWLRIIEDKGGSYVVIAIIFLATAGVVKWGKSGRIKEILLVTTSSGESEALSSYTPGHIQKIEVALNKALIYRG